MQTKEISTKKRMTMDEKSSFGDMAKSNSSPEPARINLDLKNKEFKTAEATPVSGGASPLIMQ